MLELKGAAIATCVWTGELLEARDGGWWHTINRGVPTWCHNPKVEEKEKEAETMSVSVRRETRCDICPGTAVDVNPDTEQLPAGWGRQLPILFAGETTTTNNLKMLDLCPVCVARVQDAVRPRKRQRGSFMTAV